MDISVVIPCWRSEDTIENVVNEIEATMKTKPSVSYEIVLVNDCSPDGVWQVIERMSKEKPYVKGVSLLKNFGQHPALMAGYRHTSGDIVVSMDDDGQTDGSAIFTLIDMINQGWDVVYADYPQKKESPFRLLGSRFNEIMNEKMLGKPKEIVPNSYFAMKRIIVNEIIKYDNPYPYVDGLLFRVTKNIGKVEINHRERESGASGYTLKKLLSLWLNGFTTFSIVPLRASTFLGALCAAVGFIVGLVLIILRFIDTEPVSGWTSTIAAILFIGGINMLMLGMIGEYIGRIYMCINKSPQYIERSVIGEEDNKNNK